MINFSYRRARAVFSKEFKHIFRGVVVAVFDCFDFGKLHRI